MYMQKHTYMKPVYLFEWAGVGWEGRDVVRRWDGIEYRHIFLYQYVTRADFKRAPHAVHGIEYRHDIFKINM